MNHYRTAFPRIGWLPLFAAVVLMAVGVLAGNWQTRRAAAKVDLQQRITAATRAEAVDLLANNLTGPQVADLVWRHVRIRGTWLPEKVIYLDNRMRGREAGLFVIMPLRVTDAAGTATVLVNRGWLPRDPAERTRIKSYPTPAGLVTVEGVMYASEPRLLELGGGPPPQIGALWQNLDFEIWQRAAGTSVVPMVLRQDPQPTVADGLVREWPEAGALLTEQIGKHRGYAFQWHGLATLMLVLVVVFEVRRWRALPVAPAAPGDAAAADRSAGGP